MKILLTTLLLLPQLLLPTAPDFVIKPKKTQKTEQAASRDELKEQVGDATRVLFKQMTTTIDRMGDALLDAKKKHDHQQFGTLNKQIAATQRLSSTLIEKLVENDKVYKKVTKLQLKQLITQLDATKAAMVGVCNAIGTSNFVQQVINVRTVVVALQSDSAVKIICQ